MRTTTRTALHRGRRGYANGAVVAPRRCRPEWPRRWSRSSFPSSHNVALVAVAVAAAHAHRCERPRTRNGRHTHSLAADCAVAFTIAPRTLATIVTLQPPSVTLKLALTTTTGEDG